MIPEFVGPQLAELRELIPALASSAGPLLIIGEEGVGKSLLALHIHAVAEDEVALPSVNLATASPRNGFLSLLGADFEPLTSTKRSALEHEGIVLIKHVDAAPRSVQDQLADALRNGRFIRPGAIRKSKVCCRPFFTLRLSKGEGYDPLTLSPKLVEYLAPVRTLTIPPLRDRPADIRAIARRTLGRDLTPELERVLLAYRWPGNVTELKATLVLLRPLAGEGNRPADDCLLEVASLLLGIEEGRESSMRDAMFRIEKRLATHAFRRTDGHLTRAAQLLGLTPNALKWHLRKNRPNL